jgi:hypothetical protein
MRDEMKRVTAEIRQQLDPQQQRRFNELLHENRHDNRPKNGATNNPPASDETNNPGREATPPAPANP